MKNKDGYVLVYVVFVIILLCVVAGWLCSSALGGIKVQREVVTQMQNRYAAESAVEKFAAKTSVSRDDSFERADFDTEPAAREGAKAEFESLLAAAASEMGVTIYDVQWSGSCCLVDVSSAAEGCLIAAHLEFSLQIDVSSREEDEEDYFEYSIAGVTSKYLSFEMDGEGGAV